MTVVVTFGRAMRTLLVMVALAIAGAALFLGYSAYTIPVIRAGVPDLPPAAVVYATAAGAPFAARGVYKGERLAADKLPPDLSHAVVAIEDRRFYRHHGVDPRGIARAAWHNVWNRGRIEGGSTITQQLTRLTYLSSERTLHRKVQEMMLALWLDARLPKDEILARYLNTVYFGAGAFGADAAAKRYFGKKAGELDLAQSAMLAGLVRAPSQLAPSRNFEAAHRRAELVLDAMVETGMTDAAKAAAARAETVRLAIPPDTEPDDNYFIDTAEAEVKRLIGSPPLDLAVTTTLDPRLQQAAERIVKRTLAGEGLRRHVGQAAMIAMAPDGAILALVGGRDYNESQFNRAVQAKRQPGSLFKVFVYLTALSNGYTPESVIVDQPVEIGDWQPKNYDGRYRGPVSLKTAFANSLNSVSAQLIEAVGPKRVVDMAKSLGVRTELPAVPSLALGAAEVTLIDMVRAMDAIATDAKSIEPYLVRSIRAEAAPLYTRPETAAERPDWNRPAMMRLLEAVVGEGTGKAARIDRRSAGKTGTTDEYRDAWFVGFTSDLVVGVWVGNDDNSPTDRVTGGDIPARLWHDFVMEAERILATPIAAATRPGAAPVAGTVQTAALTGPAPRAVSGVPFVIDSATLLLNGALVRLNGIAGQPGDPAHELSRYIAGREVACEPIAPDKAQYRCTLGDFDLGEAVLLNGAGRAADGAPDRLKSAEQKARQAGRGIWSR
jgi:penicillin-binding protein 1A